jgi:pimeloyl-ACP methyl ester carboxylesterase
MNRPRYEIQEIKHNGPVLLFLHGFPDDRSLWDEQIAHFRRSFHILNAGLPRREEDLHPETLVDELLRILAPLKRKKIILVGHDLGACLAEEAARPHPPLPDSPARTLALPENAALRCRPLNFRHARPVRPPADPGGDEALLPALLPEVPVDRPLAHLRSPGEGQPPRRGLRRRRDGRRYRERRLTQRREVHP